MTLQETSVNIFSGVKTLMYIFCAIVAFICTYPFYETIKGLNGISTTASITISLVFWVVAFTVVYMGAYWMYTKGGNKVEP